MHQSIQSVAVDYCYRLLIIFPPMPSRHVFSYYDLVTLLMLRLLTLARPSYVYGEERTPISTSTIIIDDSVIVTRSTLSHSLLIKTLLFSRPRLSLHPSLPPNFHLNVHFLRQTTHFSKSIITLYCRTRLYQNLQHVARTVQRPDAQSHPSRPKLYVQR